MVRVVRIHHADFDRERGSEVASSYADMLRTSIEASIAAAQNAGMCPADLAEFRKHLEGFRFIVEVLP